MHTTSRAVVTGVLAVAALVAPQLAAGQLARTALTSGARVRVTTSTDEPVCWNISLFTSGHASTVRDRWQQAKGRGGAVAVVDVDVVVPLRAPVLQLFSIVGVSVIVSSMLSIYIYLYI